MKYLFNKLTALNEKIDKMSIAQKQALLMLVQLAGIISLLAMIGSVIALLLLHTK